MEEVILAVFDVVQAFGIPKTIFAKLNPQHEKSYDIGQGQALTVVNFSGIAS